MPKKPPFLNSISRSARLTVTTPPRFRPDVAFSHHRHNARPFLYVGTIQATCPPRAAVAKDTQPPRIVLPQRLPIARTLIFAGFLAIAHWSLLRRGKGSDGFPVVNWLDLDFMLYLNRPAVLAFKPGDAWHLPVGDFDKRLLHLPVF